MHAALYKTRRWRGSRRCLCRQPMRQPMRPPNGSFRLASYLITLVIVHSGNRGAVDSNKQGTILLSAGHTLPLIAAAHTSGQCAWRRPREGDSRGTMIIAAFVPIRCICCGACSCTHRPRQPVQVHARNTAGFEAASTSSGLNKPITHNNCEC
jgi:hypothetical protein